MNNQPKLNLHELEQFHSEEIETIKLLLAKISKRNISEIKPHLDIILLLSLSERAIARTLMRQ